MCDRNRTHTQISLGWKNCSTYSMVQTVHPKGDWSWVFIGRSGVEAETPILWPPDAKSWLTGEDPDAGKDSGQEEKGTTEDEMVGWHHWLNGHGFGWTPGVGDGQGGLVCCNSWGRRESDTTEQLNWTELNWTAWSLALSTHLCLFLECPCHDAPCNSFRFSGKCRPFGGSPLLSTSPPFFKVHWKSRSDPQIVTNSFKSYYLFTQYLLRASFAPGKTMYNIPFNQPSKPNL